MTKEHLCEVFGECGGCRYQHLSYSEELEVKQALLRDLFIEGLGLNETLLEPITPSPKEAAYRNGLDMTFIRTRKEQKILMGFMREGSKRTIITVDTCPIADAAVSSAIPQIRSEAAARLPEKKRLANIVIKTGDDGRVLWGGIGRGSLRLSEENYLWTRINGHQIHYSLDTFFQANTSILPKVIEVLRRWYDWDSDKTVFYDLYAGVGLFGFLMSDVVRAVVMIEREGSSMNCAKFTRDKGRYDRVSIHEGACEMRLPEVLADENRPDPVAFVDPPRKGLSEAFVQMLDDASQFRTLFYLSCGPESLQRDLTLFKSKGWEIRKIAGFDFFPKTKHIETLVHLNR